MKMANMSTQFSCRLEVLDDRYLRISLLLVVDLDLEVELALDNLLIAGAGDSLGRGLRGNLVEKPMAHCFLNCSVSDPNLICIVHVLRS